MRKEYYNDQFSHQAPMVCLINPNKEFPEIVEKLSVSKIVNTIADTVYSVDLIIAKMRSSQRV